MSRHEPVAYTYEADYHCPACTEARFGRGRNGFIAEDSVDREGNPVGVVAPWDEWYDPDEGYQTLACGTCGEVIETYGEADLERCDRCPVCDGIGVLPLGDYCKDCIARLKAEGYVWSPYYRDFLPIGEARKVRREMS